MIYDKFSNSFINQDDDMDTPVEDDDMEGDEEGAVGLDEDESMDEDDIDPMEEDE